MSVRAVERRILAVLGLALLLTGCSAGSLEAQLPGDLGLPAAAPARPVTPYEYPAVHDMPQARAIKPLTEEEQIKLEKDLNALRDRQVGHVPAVKKAAPKAKKPPAAANNGQSGGAKTNP
jgi:hypothetical protein